MIKISGEFLVKFEIPLDVDSFDDICVNKMTLNELEELDDLIKEEIYRFYQVYPDEIRKVQEVKKSK